MRLIKVVDNNAGKDLEKIAYFRDVRNSNPYMTTVSYVMQYFTPIDKLGIILYGR